MLILAYLPILALYLVLFSEVGFGASVFKTLTLAHEWSALCAALGVLVIVILYLVDGDFGNPVVNGVFYLVGLLAFIVSVVLTFRTMPFAPILCFFFLMTLYYIGIYFEFFNKDKEGHHVSIKCFLVATSKAMIVGGVLGVAVAVTWASYYNYWWGKDRFNLSKVSAMIYSFPTHTTHNGSVLETLRPTDYNSFQDVRRVSAEKDRRRVSAQRLDVEPSLHILVSRVCLWQPHRGGAWQEHNELIISIVYNSGLGIVYNMILG